MPHPLRRLTAAIVACWLACSSLSAAEATKEPTPGSVTAPQHAGPTVDQLVADLPQVAEIARHGDHVAWQSGSVSLAVVDAVSGDMVVDSGLGRVTVPRRLVAERHDAAIAQLPALVQLAKAGGVTGPGLVFQEGILTGPSLRTQTEVVVAQGVLRKQPKQSPDRAADLARIADAVKGLRALMPSTGLDAIAQGALDDVLGRLGRPDGDQALDEVAPSFARRVVRHGWMRRWFQGAAGAAAVTALEQAVAAAEQPAPTTVFTDHALRLEEVADAFGRGAWVWHRGDRVLYARREPAPEYLGHVPPLMTVVELPAGSDPGSEAGKALAARVFAGQDEVADWTQADGFRADPARWRAAVPEIGGDVTPDAIPPHIVIADLHGDIGGLAVERGLLRPAADGSRPAAERFLADAGKLLPDAAHLDLIGEYLFTYVYPSPDTKHPELLGNKQAKGNIQQTVWQTCGNVCGGLMHGDCADIAELYHAITSSQGRNPIIIGLPEHAACAWADKSAAGWNVHVLQTGPPLAFSDAQLPDCLGKAYKSFDPTMAFDPNQVPLLLRFSGEVSRSSWQLSWRIFSDPAYRATMVDVQRDWHFQTYQRGIATMEKLIADGDDDNANYRELAGLAASTGQFDLAVKFHRQAMARTNEEANRLGMAVELVGFLLGAGHQQEAEKTVADILDHQLPGLRAELGDSLPRIGIELAATCLDEQGGHGMRAMAVRVLTAMDREQIAPAIDQLAGWLDSPKFNREAWDNDTGLRSIRALVGDYAGVIVSLIAAGRPEDAPGDAEQRALRASAQTWLDRIAFHDIDEDSAVMGRYALAGEWYGATLGEAELDKRLDATQMPDGAKVDHAARVGGAAQLQRDLPWIRASVPYWYSRLAKLFRRNRTSIDAAQAARLAARLVEARAATAKLGLSDPFSEGRAILGAGVAALVAHDDAALRRMLHQVAESNAKELRDDAAQWLGDAARFMPPDWYAKVLKAWVDEVDYKPKYFWIAWRAALNDAPQQALMAAKLAAERFADDPTFAEEYAFMRRLLSTPRPTAAPAQDKPAVEVP